MHAAPWLAVAYSEVGVACHPPGSSNPRITEYHAGTNIAGYDDKASWCSSFVNWSLAKVGIVGTGSALSRSWLEWGEPLERPLVGCIAVLWREDPQSWKMPQTSTCWAETSLSRYASTSILAPWSLATAGPLAASTIEARGAGSPCLNMIATVSNWSNFLPNTTCRWSTSRLAYSVVGEFTSMAASNSQAPTPQSRGRLKPHPHAT